MGQLSGFSKVVAQLLDLSKIHSPQVTVEVGYSAHYSAYVHEDLTKTHRVGKAKYLEDVIRAYQTTIPMEIQQHLVQGKSMTEAMAEVGNFILRESQRLVPIDTGELYRSGYVSVQ